MERRRWQIATSVAVVLLMAAHASAQWSLTLNNSYATQTNGPTGVTVSNGYAYVISGQTNFMVYDVSVPTAAVFVASCGTGIQIGLYRNSEQIIIRGRYAYVAGGSSGGLSVIDILDPLHPVLVGRYSGRSVHDLVLSGNYAYCASSGSGMTVLNISDPTHPFDVGGCDLDGWASGIALVGTYALVGAGDLVVVDVSTPTSPVLRKRLATGGSAGGVAIRGNYAFVANGDSGVLCLNVTHPTNAVKVSSISVGDSVWRLELKDHLVVAGGRAGARVIDYADVKKPWLCASLSTLPAAAFTYDIDVNGSTIYLCGARFDSKPGKLQILSLKCTDFDDGDGKADLVLCGSNGKVRALQSASSNLWTGAWGQGAWVPAPGDYDGDGKVDPAWYVPATRNWWIYKSSSNYVEQMPRPIFGGTDDRPVAGDFDGDGKADLALRGADGKLRVWESGTGNQWTSTWGKVSWLPAMADYDGDGKTDPAWYVPSTRSWQIFESTNGYAKLLPQPVFGGTNDIPIPADIDADGKADLVLWQPTGQLRIKESATGDKWSTLLGSPAWLPAVADYDGDGLDDPAWFVPATGRWRILESSHGYTERLPNPRFGGPYDWPTATPGW